MSEQVTELVAGVERLARSFDLRVGSLNSTSWKNLRFAPAQRPHAIAERLNDRDVDLVLMQEVAEPTRRGFEQHPRWTLSPAPPNDIGTAIGNIGNAVGWRDDVLDGLSFDAAHLAMPGRPRGLYLPERLLRHEKSRGLLDATSVHVPTQWDASLAVRNRMLKQIARRAVAAHRRGIPAIVGGDWNRSDVLWAFPKGWKVAAGRGIDQLIVSPDIQVLGGRTEFEGWYGVCVDHPFVSARVRIPIVTTPRRPRRGARA